MYEEKIDSKRLAYKLLNEIKYNKRYMYNWLWWSEDIRWNDDLEGSHPTDDLLNLLSYKIQMIYDSIDLRNNSKDPKYDYDIVPIFKGIKDKRKAENRDQRNIISFDKDHEITGEIEFNDFFHCNINTLALSIIWVDTVGKIIDDNLEDNVYANRLSNKSSVFKPYFNGYSNFRDNSFEAMKAFTENNKTGIYIQIDLKKCFYNINIEKLEQLVKELIGSNATYLAINEKVFDIIKDYNNKYNSDLKNKDSDELKLLPIGFLPSNILINLYLSEVDEKIINTLHPVEYGRYVDDIGFLISTTVKKSNKKEIIRNLEKKIRNLFNETKLEINKNKTVYFVITKNNDENYLRKFEKSIEALSSDNYRLIDTVGFEEELNKSYIISESPTKLSEMFEIKRDKKHISRIISTIFYSHFGTFNEINKNKKIAENFINTLFDLIDDQFFLEIFDYWYQLTMIELSYIENIKDINDFKQTKTYAKINELLVKYDKQKKIKSFLNLYKSLLNTLNKEDLLLEDFQDYFSLPNFKIKSFERYFLNYEKQLYDIWGWYKEKYEDVDNSISKLLKIAGPEAGSGRDCEGGSFTNEDYPAEDEIIIGQANIHSYNKRKMHFLQCSKNLSTQSDFTKVFNEALEDNADILVFPEQGLTFENLPFIAKQAAKNKIAVVGGFDFILRDKFVKNLSVAIIPCQAIFNNIHNKITYKDAKIYLVPKKHPAPLEYTMFHNSTEYEYEHRSREIYIPNPKSFDNITFNYLGKKHAILNCYEATDLETKFKLSEEEPLITHLITNNQDTKYFEKIAINLSREIMGAITITNYSEFGGTLVYVPFSKRYKRVVAAHKGANNTHVDISRINLKEIAHKRRDNLNEDYKQNPPKYYYKNLGLEWEDE